MASLTDAITVVTDAGFVKEHHFGTWGCYIRGAGLVVRESGILKNHVESSTEAERQAVGNALFILASRVPGLSQYHINVYCDNISALKRPGPLGANSPRYAARQLKIAWYDEYIQAVVDRAKSYELPMCTYATTRNGL